MINECNDTIKQRMIAIGSKDERLTNADSIAPTV